MTHEEITEKIYDEYLEKMYQVKKENKPCKYYAHAMINKSMYEMTREMLDYASELLLQYYDKGSIDKQEVGDFLDDLQARMYYVDNLDLDDKQLLWAAEEVDAE